MHLCCFSLFVFVFIFADQPKVTSLTVDDNEVTGDYLINEGQKITVTCLIEKGRPAANFYLMNKNGKELKRADNDKNISHTIAVLCEDDWPVIRCEGERSEYNRSVAILVRCKCTLFLKLYTSHVYLLYNY